MIENIVIRVEAYGEKFTFEFAGDNDIHDVAIVLKKMLCCIGFANKNIEDLFCDDCI